MKQFFAVALVPAAMLTFYAGSAAFGATSWTTIGSASATGRGSFGSAIVEADTTTPAHPRQFRYVLTGSGTAHVSWSIDCWDESNYATRTQSSSGSVSLPHTGTWSTSLPHNMDYCDIDISAYKTTTGTLHLSTQYR